jgi:hypothetical protein
MSVGFPQLTLLAVAGTCVSHTSYLMPLLSSHPIVSSTVKMDCDIRVERAKALYGEDRSKELRKSHENSEIKVLYDEFLGKPGSHVAHELLHTHYQKRPMYTE